MDHVIPKYETGFRKGENIMYESDAGRRWHDWLNNIFVEVEYDDQYEPLGTFRVAERQRGNTHTIWDRNLDFETAMNLACRLVAGSDFIPNSQK